MIYRGSRDLIFRPGYLFVFRSARPFVQPAGNPPRRAGNFHSLARMKVTKVRGLDTSDHVYFPCDQTVGRRPNAPPPCPVGCLRAHPTQHRLHRSSTVRSVSPLGRYQHAGPTRRPSCVPRCGGIIGSAFASTDWRDGPDGSGALNLIEHRRWPKAPGRAGRRRIWPSTDSLVAYEPNQVAGVEGLCFGDFHLARQMKVTRPPGRDPARCRE